ncbi:hypothetical protein RI065_03080 [Mycoplasmatota bacterium zrk1]
MKYKYLVVFLIFLVSTVSLKADTVKYPYDEIVILRAYTFKVSEDTTETNGNNFLLELVHEDNPIIEVKVASFNLYTDGKLSVGDESIIIVSGTNGTIRFLNNGYSKHDVLDDSDKVIGYIEEYQFWNHKILTDTGVVKSKDMDTRELTIVYDSLSETYTLESYDEETNVSTSSDFFEESFKEVIDEFTFVFNNEEE